MADHARNLEIEALRAFAVLFVIFGHINTLLLSRQQTFDAYVNFYGGVDLFFCVSGFVITSAFAKEMTVAAGEPHSYWRAAAAFWVRRIFRIWPLAWTVFLGTALLMLYAHSWRSDVISGIIGDFAAVALNLQNIHLASCIGATSPYCGSFFGVYWSLSLEEQFYLVFPFLFLLPRRLMVLGLVGIVVLFAFLPRTPMVWMVRLDAIALGVLLALCKEHWLYDRMRPTFLSNSLLRPAALVGLLLALCVIPATLPPFFPTIVSLITLLLVFLASYSEEFLVGPGLPRRILVWIGERSFAIYLLHNPVFWLVAGIYRRAFPVSSASAFKTMLLLVIATLLLVVLAEVSFRFLETPLRRYGKRLATTFTMVKPPATAPELSVLS